MYIQTNEGLAQAPGTSSTAATSTGSPFQQIQAALVRGQWYLALSLAVLFGDRDMNRLTNMIFFARHPERGGRKLEANEPNFSQFSREWLDIREQLVRPLLEKLQPAQPVTPGKPSPSITTPSTGECVRAGSCTACERRLRAAPPPRLETVPAEFQYYKSGQQELDAQASRAYQQMVQAARAAGISTPYLKLVSGFRDYDRQGRLWKGRLLTLFKKLGCSEANLPCIGSAIDRTTTALKHLPMPHSSNAWLNRFIQELKDTGCASTCDPNQAVKRLRQGTAPPGRSPHHTGRALDIHVGGRLSTNSTNVAYQHRQAAYQWLVCNAAHYGFYPYHREPWHWEYNPPT